jgi:hypothetical protein
MKYVGKDQKRKDKIQGITSTTGDSTKDKPINVKDKAE